LYARDEPRDYKGKIEKIENEMKTLPVARMMTNTMLSFTPVRPYIVWHDHSRKSVNRSFALGEEEIPSLVAKQP